MAGSVPAGPKPLSPGLQGPGGRPEPYSPLPILPPRPLRPGTNCRPSSKTPAGPGPPPWPGACAIPVDANPHPRPHQACRPGAHRRGAQRSSRNTGRHARTVRRSPRRLSQPGNPNNSPRNSPGHRHGNRGTSSPITPDACHSRHDRQGPDWILCRSGPARSGHVPSAPGPRRSRSTRPLRPGARGRLAHPSAQCARRRDDPTRPGRATRFGATNDRSGIREASAALTPQRPPHRRRARRSQPQRGAGAPSSGGHPRAPAPHRNARALPARFPTFDAAARPHGGAAPSRPRRRSHPRGCPDPGGTHVPGRNTCNRTDTQSHSSRCRRPGRPGSGHPACQVHG